MIRSSLRWLLGSARAARISAAVLAIACTSITSAAAHPGSGIVVDARGRVYFTDTGKGIALVDQAGRLSYVPGEAFHWMAMDEKGAFDHADLGAGFQRLTAAGQRPVLVTASDFPFTFGRDGSLYYPGPLGLHRRRANGRDDVFVSKTKSGNLLRGITGAAGGPDGSLYLMSLDGSSPDEGTDQHAIIRVGDDGRAAVFAKNFITPATVGPTEAVPGSRRTYSRGLAVDKSGTVFVAATGSRVVLSIDSNRKVRAVLRAEPPWTPTGVAIHGSTLYVLEYDVTAVPARGMAAACTNARPDRHRDHAGHLAARSLSRRAETRRNRGWNTAARAENRTTPARRHPLPLRDEGVLSEVESARASRPR